MSNDTFRSPPPFRAFLAVAPPDPLRGRLAALQDRLRAAGSDVKWVEPGNIHLTLKFLGALSDAARPAVDAAMEAVAASHAAFDLDVKGTGAFPERGAPKVVWAGCIDAGNRLAALARAVEQAVAPAGFPPEGRPFAAHVTLGRVKSPRNAARLRALLERDAESDFGACRVDAFHLYRSDPSPRGPAYAVVRTFPLMDRATPMDNSRT